MRYLSLLLLGFVLICSACRKDKEIITEEVFHGPNPEVLINTSISGVVIDEAQNPIAEATVTVANKSLQTDDNGFFYFKDILANRDGANVVAIKKGYFELSTLVYPKLNSVSFVEITLLESDGSGLVMADQGGIVAIDGGASVSFPKNAFVLNGNPYQGEVEVKAVFLDPTRRDLLKVMPGSLIGVQEDGSIVGMTTYGMIGVELESESGQKLELADNVTASLYFPLPPNVRQVAPGEIKLWSYDMKYGYWKEEGVALLDGDGYKAEVSHFSFWNCDDPFELVNMRGRVVSKSGDPVTQAKISLKIKNSPTNNTGHGSSGMDGYFQGKIPKDRELELVIKDQCDLVIHIESVGPFSNDVDLGEFSIDQGTEIRVKGQLLDCNNNPVENGYVLVTSSSGRGYLTPGVDGIFDANFFSCDQSDILVVGKDLEGQMQGAPQQFTYASTVDVGTIQACGSLLPFINLTVDGERHYVEPCWAVDTMGQTILSAEDNDSYVGFVIEGNEVGVYSLSSGNFRLSSSNLTTLSDIAVEVTFNSYGSSRGEFVVGTLSGTAIENGTGGTITIEGSFRAEIQ